MADEPGPSTAIADETRADIEIIVSILDLVFTSPPVLPL
jgi:hypothetical protein